MRSTPETVLSFDRDSTVDVNPPEDQEREAVPLSWVKYFAHECDEIAVWVHGNQKLCDEGSLPGMATAIDLWTEATSGDPWADFELAGESTSAIPYHHRRDRLRIIQDLYTDAPRGQPEFIVIDDADLSDLSSEGWTHYFSWDFVPELRNGDGPVNEPNDNPYCSEPADSESCSCKAKRQDMWYRRQFALTSP